MTIPKRLSAWPRVPFDPPKEQTCIICRCTESKACQEGCGWEELVEEFNIGVCTQCAQHRLCALGAVLAIASIGGARWKPRKDCPCPLCVGGKKERKR